MEPEQEMNNLNEHSQLVGTVGAINQQAQQSAATQYYIQEQEKSLAEAQLECDKTLNEIYHLLRQDILKPNEKGMMDWYPIDKKFRALTDQGVDRWMQVMKFYINKDTLLSNFSEEQINKRMLEFCYALNANIFLKYELYFYKPSFEECVDILKSRLKEKSDLKKYARDILGLPVKEKEINDEIVARAEYRIEDEINKIRKERIRQNLREYELLFVQMKAIVEAVHNRALKGEERGSLRRHTQISEILGNKMTQPQQKEGGMFKWVKG